MSNWRMNMLGVSPSSERLHKLVHYCSSDPSKSFSCSISKATTMGQCLDVDSRNFLVKVTLGELIQSTRLLSLLGIIGLAVVGDDHEEAVRKDLDLLEEDLGYSLEVSVPDNKTIKEAVRDTLT